MSPVEQVGHVCLAGRKVSNDWTLIQRLKVGHHLTLVEQVEWLADALFLETAQVLVLDCAECVEGVRDILPLLRKLHPVLGVLLVDGQLNQRQVVEAFQEGVRDYFPDPYDAYLLAERVHCLCAPPPGGGP